MRFMDDLHVFYVIEEINECIGGYRNWLALIGGLYAANVCLKVIFSCFRAFRVYLLPRIWQATNFKTKYGEWAVVTGASEGIGRAYARELAKRGMSVVLISRSYTKLEKVATEIEKKFKVETKIITGDFNEVDSVYDKIRVELSALEIGVLVNNVGIMYDRLQYFIDVPKERLLQIVNLNITATLMMTQMVLPQMVARGKGAIINLSSGACVHPVPLMTAYSASKKYIDYYSRALHYEYCKSGIVVQSVQPYYVSTSMMYHCKQNVLIPSPEDYVDHAIRTLPVTSRTYGYWSHGLFGLIGELMPLWFFNWSCVHVNLPIWRFFTGQ